MRSSLPAGFSTILSRPFPVADLFPIDAFGVGIADAVDNLALQPLFHMRADGAQTRNTVDDVDRKIKTINLVQDRQLKRCVDVASFLVSTHMNVFMVPATVAELVDQRGVGMEVENNRLVDSE